MFRRSMMSVAPSVYLFIISGCSTFNCKLLSNFSNSLFSVVYIRFCMYSFFQTYTNVEGEKIKCKWMAKREQIFAERYRHAICRQNGKLAAAKKCIIYRITTRPSSAYFRKVQKKRTIVEQINQTKSVPKKKPRLMQNVILCSFSRMLQSKRAKERVASKAFVRFGKYIYFYIRRRTIYSHGFRYWHSVCTAVNDYFECIRCKRP